jgi:hypothetical protein
MPDPAFRNPCVCPSTLRGGRLHQYSCRLIVDLNGVEKTRVDRRRAKHGPPKSTDPCPYPAGRASPKTYSPRKPGSACTHGLSILRLGRIATAGTSYRETGNPVDTRREPTSRMAETSYGCPPLLCFKIGGIYTMPSATLVSRRNRANRGYNRRRVPVMAMSVDHVREPPPLIEFGG